MNEAAGLNNPFGIAEERDLLREPQRDSTGWSETEFFAAWDSRGRVGVFIHAGRCPQDLDLWWAQTAVFLPDGRITVDRSWGRPSSRQGIKTGNLTLLVEQPLRRWFSTFDGAGELADSASLLKGAAGGGRAVPMSWEFVAEAIAPAWDMGGAAANSSIGTSHTQQAFRTSGFVKVDRDIYELEGVGFNDHSSGVRSLGGFGGDNFLVAVFPDFVVHAVAVWDRSGQHEVFAGAVLRGGEATSLTGMSRVALDDLLGQPHAVDIRLTAATGDILLHAEIQHCLPLTITDSNDNLIGLAPSPDDPIFFAECPVRLTTASGDVGFGHLERSVRGSLAPMSTRRVDHA
jgi:hypothetical protein